jgi:uncharacterized integral membrane protein (TIGR00697 family)
MIIERRVGLFIFLAAAFCTALVVGDLTGAKLFEVHVFGLDVLMSVGMLSFPVTFLLTDLLNEFYGSKAARFVTWVGFVMGLASIITIIACVRVPIAALTRAPGWTGVTDDQYASVFGGSLRILFASLAAYLAGQFADIASFHAFKKLSHNKLLWLRATGSTFISQLIDTVLVQSLAWYGMMPNSQIWHIVGSSYVVKLLIAVGLTPLIYGGHVIMERWLGIEPVILGEDGEPLPYGQHAVHVEAPSAASGAAADADAGEAVGG